ncbi:hypothetical protein ACFXTO_015562 [Malus domestica]
MPCMKKDTCRPIGVVVTRPTIGVATGMAGAATGATSAMSVGTTEGSSSVSGNGELACETAVTGGTTGKIRPLGRGFAAGTVVGSGLNSLGCTSSMILAELANPRVMATSKM